MTAAKLPFKRWTGSLPTPAPAFNSAAVTAADHFEKALRNALQQPAVLTRTGS